MKPRSREELKDYCLRRLGHPVIKINVADVQLEDLIDDALQFFADYHFDGVVHLYMPHEITEENLENKYIDVPDEILSVVGIFPIATRAKGDGVFFDVEYQMRLTDWDIFTGIGGLHFYDHTKRYLNMMRDILNGVPNMKFNRHTNKIYIDTDWNRFQAGSHLMFDCYRVVDPDEYPDVYNDLWLKRYLTALFKKQWGANLKKYSGAQLPGGTTFNGQQIFDEAQNEINTIEEQVHSAFQLPTDFIVG